MGELVKTRWVSASGGDVGVELTAVVSIVMVGLLRYRVSMYTGPRCEAYTYARCLRTPEGFSSWSGEAMVAEAVGLGHKRGTQPQTRRSSCLGGHPEANCETDGVAKSEYWGGRRQRAKAGGRDREAACRGPQRLAAAATKLVSSRLLCLWGGGVQPQWGGQRDNLSRAGAWEAARGCKYLERSCGVDGREEEARKGPRNQAVLFGEVVARLLPRSSVLTSSRLGGWMGTITLKGVVGGAVAMICSTAGQRHGPRIKVKKGRERKKEVGRNGALALACNALTTRLQRPRFPMELRSGEEETGPRDGGNAVTVAVVWEIEKGKGEGERVRRLLPPVVGGLLSLSRPRPEPPRSTRRGCANRLANQGAGPF